ncbi:cytochrome ubiquinol oxidase subunit I [Sporolituus thermophilus]|uniref:Cytochrome bd-I ubiquinol oxidase subunit 1 apoprotein n=1 Tax=Sporolituus thermophilus DSM 23256 TaxID=1123285 RepID=A0A1G7MM52_9FIRM|nr:cytochrome ubiquinol oxidase subunit I [Sporolituus thermophilus]SDF62190.1 cytochrome bd-I ubiquinol oxidase subunit 1 apoprotein [Sporolituus thermophilus DSM 23256]
MSELFLARWQFGITATYHFLFVPLTLGLSILVAVMEMVYVRTGNELYKKLAQFWGKLFIINFTMGVVTGIVQEFHFGMNWSEYSRFMGDIFGAPLALEALTAFFLESTFLGLWIFGWDKLPKAVHAACIAIVAFSSNLSAFWILVANSFMQSPVGYTIQNGRAEMTDFFALITNPYVAHQYPHTFLAGLVTAGVFVMAISAWHFLRQTNREFFRASFSMGLVCTLIGVLLLIGSGHMQAQYLAKVQPMKLAAAEALWETADPAPFTLFAAIDESNKANTAELKIPGLLSFLVHNSTGGEVKGLKELQAEYVQKYGPGDYIPPVTPVFWSFRIMVAAGGWLAVLAVVSAYLWRTNRLESSPRVLKAIVWSLPIPYIANSAGWFVAEAGRQPWIVYGLQRVDQAVSPTVTAGEIWITLIGFTAVYGVLAAAAGYLMRKFAVQGMADQAPAAAPNATGGATLWN